MKTTRNKSSADQRFETFVVRKITCLALKRERQGTADNDKAPEAWIITTIHFCMNSR